MDVGKGVFVVSRTTGGGPVRRNKWIHVILLKIVMQWVLFMPPLPAAAQQESGAEDYRIAPGDVLEISVYGEQDLVRQLVVRPDGKVSFPLVGDLDVAGKTTTEVKKYVEEKVSGYIPTANASVIVMKLDSLQFSVLGKVNRPGQFTVSKPLTVLEALALAGGTTPFAKENKILIIRGHGARSQRIPFNLEEIKEGKKLEQNIILERQDVVIVP